MILHAKKLWERFTKKDCKKQIQSYLELKKMIKRKGDRLYFKWKSYDSSFNGWIDKKGII